MDYEFPDARWVGALPPLANTDRLIISFDTSQGHVELAIARDDAQRLVDRIKPYLGTEKRCDDSIGL